MEACGLLPEDSSASWFWLSPAVTAGTRRQPPRARPPPASGSPTTQQLRSPRIFRRQRKPVSAVSAGRIFTQAGAALRGSTCRRSVPTSGRSRSPTCRSMCGSLSASATRTSAPGERDRRRHAERLCQRRVARGDRADARVWHGAGFGVHRDGRRYRDAVVCLSGLGQAAGHPDDAQQPRALPPRPTVGPRAAVRKLDAATVTKTVTIARS